MQQEGALLVLLVSPVLLLLRILPVVTGIAAGSVDADAVLAGGGAAAAAAVCFPLWRWQHNRGDSDASGGGGGCGGVGLVSLLGVGVCRTCRI